MAKRKYGLQQRERVTATGTWLDGQPHQHGTGQPLSTNMATKGALCMHRSEYSPPLVYVFLGLPLGLAKKKKSRGTPSFFFLSS